MRIVLLFVTLLSFAQPSLTMAQNTAELRGHVTDPSGLVVAGANVALQDSGRRRYQATSGPDGAYVFSSLTPGDYIATASAPQLSLPTPRAITIRAANNTLNLQALYRYSESEGHSTKR